MERVMSVEEKIRRAEEIYERKRQGENKTVAKVTVNDKKDIKLLRKIIIQILVCVAIYLIIYTINNNQYVFSEDFINKVNEILSYDTNFGELYNKAEEMIKQFFNKNEVVLPENSIGGAEGSVEENIVENVQNTTNESQVQQEVNNESNEQNDNENNNEVNIQTLSQEEQDIINIKNTSSFIKPVEGVISSKFGYRESATGSVPKNHTGTDIAANIGTKIKSATDGEVVLASEVGDYR